MLERTAGNPEPQGPPSFMVMGAGIYQLPLIEAAKERGMRVIVLSTPGDHPGIGAADLFLPIDTTDAPSVLAAAREHSIAGIATTGSDVCVPSIGSVVDELGLAGTGLDAAHRSMDKAAMKLAFERHGVPTAAFEIVESIEDAERAIDAIGLPVAVKAVDSSGSRGITRVDSMDGLEDAWSDARAVTRRPSVLIEEWLGGEEFGAQAIIVGDRMIGCVLHNDTTTPPPRVIPIGHSVPFSSPDLAEEAEVAIQSAIDALGIRQTVSNVDLMLTTDGIKILEIGARMGGTCLPELASWSLGVDLHRWVIDLACGDTPVLEPHHQEGVAAAMLMFVGRDGTIAPTKGADRILEEARDVIEHVSDLPHGGPVFEFTSGNRRIGHVIVEGVDIDASERRAEELAAAWCDGLEWIDRG